MHGHVTPYILYTTLGHLWRDDTCSALCHEQRTNM